MVKKQENESQSNQTLFNFRWFFLIVLIILILSAFGPTTIDFLFIIGEKWDIFISSSFSKAEILDYYGIILAFLGTMFLGGITLWQNHQIEKLNDKAQEKLNKAVEKLADANQIIAGENQELIELERKNQRIQLLLAQEYYPFLEFIKIDNLDTKPNERLTKNDFFIQQRGDTVYITPRDQPNVRRKQIQFEVLIAEYTTYQGYIVNQFQLILENNSKAKIYEVDISSIKFFNDGTLSKIFHHDELQGDEISIIKFLSSDRVVYDFKIICSDDDNSVLFPKNIEILFRIVTTTGVVFSETLVLKSIGNPSPEIEYKIDGI